MEEAVSARTPAHLWIVGGLATLWNAFGCVDYLMTRLRSSEWLSQGGGDPEAMLAWIDSFPLWVQAGWAIGVWFGLAGSIFLLMRRRWAVRALGLSMVGAIVSLGYQLAANPPPPPMNEGSMAMLPVLMIVITVALFLYARRQERNGLLR